MSFVNVNVNFDLNSPDNFWVQNPQLSFYPPYSELYNSDTSKNHSDSSRAMWVINFMQNPDEDENRFFRLNKESRKTVLTETFHKTLNWEDPLFKKCYMAFPRDCMDSIKRSLKVVADNLDKTVTLIGDTELTLDKSIVEEDDRGKKYVINIKGTSSQILKLQKDFNVIMERFEKIWDKYVANKSKMQTVGNSTIPKGERKGYW